jgi:hypothetical protein
VPAFLFPPSKKEGRVRMMPGITALAVKQDVDVNTQAYLEYGRPWWWVFPGVNYGQY